MIKQLQSTRGVSFMDVMVALIVLLSFAGMMVTSTIFMAQNQQAVREDTYFNTHIHNTVMALYAEEDWSEQSHDTIETTDGSIDITYAYTEADEPYYTESLEVSFELNEQRRVHTLERSVFRHE